MRCLAKTNYKIIILIPIFIAILSPVHYLYSQGPTSSDIQINVQLAICGNEIVEWGEDCEPTIYEVFSCSLLGYEGGNVECDNSCKFDFSECIIPEPPEPPIIIDIIEEESVEKYVPETRIREAPFIYEYPLLRYFDFNGNGKIDSNEFVASVKLWGQYWKMYREKLGEISSLKCDLNRDGKCNIVDLSILLYYRK